MLPVLGLNYSTIHWKDGICISLFIPVKNQRWRCCE